MPSRPSALWASPFRPFYLLGAAYAPLLALAWLGATLGWWQLPGPPLRLWHGHEFVFGFAAAIVIGIVLTALPSWAGTEEIHGAPLKRLVALWCLGRLAFWASPWLPPALVMLADALFLPAVAVQVAPPLWRAENRLYRLLLPILLALFLANLAYHSGAPQAALQLALYALMVLYVLKGGVLAPIFTGNALREKGRGDQVPFRMPLDVAATAALVLLAAADLGGAPPLATGLAAMAAVLLNGWRCARWQGWKVADVPLVLVMHLGFAWLLLALALRAAAGFGWGGEGLWLHAFTVGGLGMMMLGLMTRVSLRHTGRPLRVPRRLLAAFALMFAAAMARMAAAWHEGAVALSMLLWAAAFALYLLTFARALLAPSLPR